MRLHPLVLRAAFVCLLTVSATAVQAQSSLHEEADALLSQVTAAPPAAPTSDGEFLRRITLDLTGTLPTAEETRAFAADANPAKRLAAIDRLLASPLFPRQMAQFFDVTLMERRGNANIPQEEWHKYLFDSFQQNKPYNVLAREILSADGTATAAPRAAARFYLDRNGEPNLITRDVGRIFFGRDLQCAQCHDHPIVDDYYQLDYHSLLALVSTGTVVSIKEGDKQVNYYAEIAGADAQFESVFIKGTKHVALPQLFERPAVVETAFPVGEEYQTRPGENIRPVPKFSRRQQLAAQATDGTHRMFNENIANRLWGQMMGRGLVQPADLHHPDNPPLHPELMKRLGERFAAMNFDTRAFLRELAQTQVYQRSISAPGDLITPSIAAAGRVAELETQLQALQSTEAAAREAYNKALAEREASDAAVLPVSTEHTQALAKAADSLKKMDAAQKAVTNAQAALVAKQGIVKSVEEATAKTKEVTAKLPQDQELAQASQKFIDRLTQLSAELPALQKGVEDTTAALKAPMDELVASRTVVSGVDAKLAPLSDVLRAKDQAVQAARQAMEQAKTSTAQLKRQIETLKLVAQIKTTQDAVAAAGQTVTAGEATLEANRKLATDYLPVVAQKQTEMQTAEQLLATATQTLTGLQQEHQKQADVAKSVVDAATGAEAARVKLSQDPVLTEAAQKLKAKADELNVALAQHQTQVDAAALAMTKSQEQKTAADAALKSSQEEMSLRQQAVATTEAGLTAAKAKVEADRGAAATISTQAIDRLATELTVAPLKPLSPEQICWSILSATGVYQRHWQAEEAELNKTAPLTPEAQQDPAQVATRQREIEQRTYDKLKGNVGAFVAVFGAAAGQPQGDFFATADQALFTANAGVVTSWAGPAGGNVTERVMNQPDAAKATEDLYLSLFARTPTPDEVQDVNNYLTARAADRPAAVQELVWGLLTSAEFRFNH
jgi:hypothetical protein